MRDKGGYWYTNEKLIEIFKIEQEEERAIDKEGHYLLKTIISKSEKQRRQNEARKKARRNEQGLTSREQQKIDTISKVKKLLEQGLNQVEIAKELGINQSNISRILNNKY